MIRNEYRRAFIMLRAVMPGYGGHVRLERRTLTGSMYFIVTAPQGVGELAAVLVGQKNGEYYATPVAPLVRDRRGQLALAWQFDPRGIDGRPLEAYSWIAVVATGGPCALALTGNVEGSRTVDARALERAACALFTPGTTAGDPADDLPEPEFAPAPDQSPDGASPVAQMPSGIAPVDASSQATADDGEGDGDGATRGDVRIYTMTRARLRRLAKHGGGEQSTQPVQAQSQPAAPQSDATPQPATPQACEPLIQPATPTPAGEQPSAPPRTDARPQSTTPRSDGAQPGLQPPTPQTGDAQPRLQPATTQRAEAQRPGVTAAKQLGLDITAPWPDFAEPLRRLFATQVSAVDAPDDGFTYVAFPMPDGSGYRHGLAGLKADGGQIAALRYALPGRRAPEPPPGLEACRWFPAHGEAGFWVADEMKG